MKIPRSQLEPDPAVSGVEPSSSAAVEVPNMMAIPAIMRVLRSISMRMSRGVLNQHKSDFTVKSDAGGDKIVEDVTSLVRGVPTGGNSVTVR